ncbi:MAG TPA: UvrD-helicase domain-containing protein [Candidatus Limiplasma sp.]|nr:UvrD-helicase domain-containing protein [Candidatus Limiplasma sp.]
MPFTPAQEAAIHARNPDLLVSAAAGSGKTRVLIERIASMLQDDGLSMDRLLIVTFTHAAAAEMRERLQARIAEAAATDRAMRRQAELLETAQISTLHSFCQKLVREYFQEVDIDPQAMLGDETINANLKAQAKTETMESLYERAALGESDTCALTAKFEDRQIEAMLDEIYPFLMALPEPFEWLDACANRTYSNVDLSEGLLAQTLLADCRLLIDGIAELLEQGYALAEQPLFPDRYKATIQSDGIAVQTFQASMAAGLPAVIQAARQFSLERLPTVRNLEGEEAALRDRYKGLREQIKKGAASVAAHLPAEPETAIEHLNTMQPALMGLSRIARQMDERYAELKRERALMDFHDLERMALRILRNPAIRAEVSARYDGVFVDEYQDISAIQEAILNAVRRDVPRGTSEPPQYFFYVGDVKQSIYRFRQADPTLFMQKARAFSADENAPQRRISLNANFRSREAVLAGVNRVFSRVMRADVTEIEYDREARLYPGTPSQSDPPVSLHLFTQPVRSADKARLEAYAIGREIRRRVGEPVLDREGNPAGTLRFRDFAILGSKMKDVSGVLERTLGEMGIPVYCEDRGPAMQSEEIAQALNHLRLMDNIADDIALLACLRSPAIGMDDRELAAIRLRQGEGPYLEAVQAAARATDPLGRRCADALATLAHERFLLAETPLHEYLWGWLNRSGLYAFYGCQPNGKLRQANLRMLCEKAGEHVRRRGGELRDFLDGVQAQTGVQDGASPTVLSPWEDVVRVMTIHKSKGLEFPVVFVMGLEAPFGSRRASSLALHPRLGVALPYVNETARTTGSTLLESAIGLRLAAEEKAERARLLYVAMTRAREELLLVGCGTQLAPETFAQGFIPNREESAYAVFSAGQMLDWVCGCVKPSDSMSVADENGVSDNPLRTTGLDGGFSTQSTDNPQKKDCWNVVFHNSETELEDALRYAKGNKGLSELELRRARLNALTEDARRLANQADQPAQNPAEQSEAVDLGSEERLAPEGGPLKREGDNARDAANAQAIGGGKTRARSMNLAPNRAGYEVTVGLSAALDTAPRDPLAPSLYFPHRPFKIGATALARAERETNSAFRTQTEDEDAAAVETADQKRLPLPLARPRLMSDLPAMPAFLRAPAEQTGLRRGIATHKALSLLEYSPLGAAVDAPDALRLELNRQLNQMQLRRLLEPEERALVETETVARFLESQTGREALAADTVHREWSFNLRMPERDGLIVQGVIDLCYLKNGQWSLVDYKTDAVKDPQELWSLYGGQMAIYRRALTEASGMPVAETTLFSLSLGRGAAEESAKL